MQYKLPNDIRKTICSKKDAYPFFKPEPFRKNYHKHLRNYKKRGFWSAITWDFDEAIIQYISAALKLDNPDAVDNNGNNIVKIIDDKNSMNRLEWFDFQEELISNLTTLLNQERLDIARHLNDYLKIYFETYTNTDIMEISEYADNWITDEAVDFMPEIIFGDYYYPRTIENIKIIKDGKVYIFDENQSEDDIKAAQQYVLNWLKESA